jgi:tyrosine-protein kinase Etk/Wzc
MEENLDKNYTINNEMNLLDFLKIFIKYKKIIIIIPFSIGILMSLLLLFVIDEVFLSSAIVKTTSKTSGLSSMISQSMPDISDLGDIAGSGTSSKELGLYENILLSRRCISDIIYKFNLMEEWKSKFLQDAVKNFRDNSMVLKKDRVSGTLEIDVYDTKPQRAKDIADFLIYQLNKINIEINVQNAKTNREFIERRFTEIKEELKKSEDSLKKYQDNFGFAPDIQTKAVLSTEVQIEAELKSEEIKLDLLKKILSPEQSEIKIQEEKIKSIKEQLSNIKNTDDKLSILTLKDKPEIVLNYLRLVRNVEIQNKLLIYIIPLFEQAKIEEKKEMPSVLIIDPPNVPERKDKPKRAVTVLASIFISAIIIFFLLVIFEKWKIYKKMLNQE